MSQELPGYLLKYKTESGEWIPIPVLVNTVYQSYVAYCLAHDIEPVSEDTYYASLGRLSELVEQMAGSQEAVQELIEALDGDALPTRLGGLGVSISADDSAQYHTLVQFFTDGVGLITASDVTDQLADIQDDLDQKLNLAEITSGTGAPTTDTTGSIYFQIS